jgi:hypothetical protein
MRTAWQMRSQVLQRFSFALTTQAQRCFTHAQALSIDE